ncbi:MAG: metallophosphoesterase family protein [Verrucomicrobiota bacterium]
MRYAIFSDIHANLRAWEEVLADIAEQDVDVLVCLGDVVGYGPKPEEVLNAIRGVTDNLVMGNHDAAAAGAIETSYFNEHARGAIEWTIAALSEEAKDFLASVPLAIEAENILFVHAEICEPGRFGYIDEIADAHENFAGSEHFVTFVGHTHYPCIFELSNDGSVVEHPDENRQLRVENRYIVNVGSVGEPRSPDDLRGRYVIYNSETLEVEFRGVTFDISAYRADLESTTLSIKPYFLQVFDHLLGETAPVEEAARAIDMVISDDQAPLIKQRGPARLHIPTGPVSGEIGGYVAPQPEEKTSSRTVLFVAIGAVLAAAIAISAFLMTGSETKSNTVLDDNALVAAQAPDAQVEPLFTETVLEPADSAPEPQLEPEPAPPPPAAAVIAEPTEPVISIDFNLSAAANQSGTPLNVDGLTLDGQDGAWHDLQVGAQPNTDTNKELKIDTKDGVFTFNPSGAGVYRAFSGGGDELRQDGVLLNPEAAGPIEWNLGGLTPHAGYDLILFAQADNGVRGNPVDFVIVGFNDSNPAALDSDHDGNFPKVIADAKGEIHGFFALREGQAHSAWAGLQFRRTSKPTIAAVPKTNPPAANPGNGSGADIVFENFEKPDYAGWEVTGEAFGKGPIAITEIPAYQNEVNGVGARVVNSHASAPGGEMGRKDNATGSLLSRPFQIERNFLTFRVGGGQRELAPQGAPAETGVGVSLIIDGAVVRSVTGHNNNWMRSVVMDVATFRGKTAQLKIVDAASGGWGNIGVDHIVFTNTAPETAPVPPPEIDSTIAWWRMEANSADDVLVDAKENHALLVEATGSAIGALAPSPIPQNKIQNEAALSIGVWSEPAPADIFSLSSKSSFTFEGWVVTAKPLVPIFVAGTRSGEANDSQGWHVDIRPGGRMAFFYDHGAEFVQALSEDVSVSDLKPHHFAAVWDHDASAAAGEMRFYFEGDHVASTQVPHARIPVKQANPFRIGAPTNPPKIGLDEVRFSHAALSPLEFLNAEPQRMAKNGKWADAANWTGGEPPSGTQTAVIGPGVAGQVEAPTKFSGDLVLEAKATLALKTPQSKGVLPAPPSKLVLHQGSQLFLMMPRGGDNQLKRIELVGSATIWGGRSTTGHHANHSFNQKVTGPGALILNGTNNNEFILRVANTFRGGFVAKSTQNQGFRVRAKAAGCFSMGEVKIDPHGTLILDVEGATTAQNILKVQGAKDNRSATKLILNANNTVAEFHFNGAKQKPGTWGSPDSNAANKHPQISGSGILMVTR